MTLSCTHVEVGIARRYDGRDGSAERGARREGRREMELVDRMWRADDAGIK